MMMMMIFLDEKENTMGFFRNDPRVMNPTSHHNRLCKKHCNDQVEQCLPFFQDTTPIDIMTQVMDCDDHDDEHHGYHNDSASTEDQGAKEHMQANAAQDNTEQTNVVQVIVAQSSVGVQEIPEQPANVQTNTQPQSVQPNASTPNTTTRRPSTDSNSTQNTNGKLRCPLPPNFKPSDTCVLLGRGNLAQNSPGNKKLVTLVEKYVDLYKATKTKGEKSAIVTDVVDAFRYMNYPHCAFVQKDKDGTFWGADDIKAREKVGVLFRNRLEGLYKSSTASRVARRRMAKRKDKQHKSNTYNMARTLLRLEATPMST